MTQTRKHFYAVSRGRCCPSVIPTWQAASQMVLGFPKNRYKGFNTFSDARIWLENLGNNTFHFFLGPSDGDKTESNEHSGRPGCYLADNGQHAVIFNNYSDVAKYTRGCKNATQKSYASPKAAEAAQQGADQQNRGDSGQKESCREEEVCLVSGMANVSL